MSTQQATILLAHGSRDSHWLAPFQQLTQTLQKELSFARIELAFMELAEPSLEQQVHNLANQGFTQIEIIPLFFAQGRHLRQDVPLQLEAISAQLKQTALNVELSLHNPVGLEPEVIQGIQQVIGKKLKNPHT